MSSTFGRFAIILSLLALDALIWAWALTAIAGVISG